VMTAIASRKEPHSNPSGEGKEGKRSNLTKRGCDVPKTLLSRPDLAEFSKGSERRLYHPGKYALIYQPRSVEELESQRYQKVQ
jgi:hypothetical protein